VPDTDVIYSFGTYRPLVGSEFEIQPAEGGESVAVELAEAIERPSNGECFSLLFRGPPGARLDQRTYRVEHPAVGEFALFLVPLGFAADGRPELEAIVNRLGGPGD